MKVPKKCHILFEWPITEKNPKVLFIIFRGWAMGVEQIKHFLALRDNFLLIHFRFPRILVLKGEIFKSKMSHSQKSAKKCHVLFEGNVKHLPC